MNRPPHQGAVGAPSGQPDGAAPAPRDDARTHAVGAVLPEAMLDAVAEHHDDVPAARSSRRLEIICAALAVAGSAALLLAARAIEVRNETGGIDPRWWPEALATVGLVFGALLLVIAIARPPFSRDDLEAATRQGWFRVCAAIVLAVVFVLLWPVLGFVLVTPVFLIAATYLFGGRGWKTLILFPVLMTGFIYLLFHTLLKVPL